ncbi:electron transfer flavoprotein subunit alpha/FixB family protein, partial [Pseudomonas aeruginosa]
AAALGERPAGRVWQVEDGRCIGRAGAGREDIQRALPRLLLAAAECAEPVSETRHGVRELHMAEQVARNLPRIEDLGPVAVDPARIPMAEAEFIFFGGNGVQDWT